MLNSVTRSHVIDAISTHYPGAIVGAIVAVDALPQPYSIVYRLRIELNQEYACFYLKVPRINAENSAFLKRRLEIEHAVTRFAASEALASLENYCPLESVALINDPPSLLTREASGVNIQQQLIRSIRWPASDQKLQQMRELCQLLGRWLRRFHDVAPIELSDRRERDVADYCKLRLDTLIALPHTGISHELATRVVARAKAMEAEEAFVSSGVVCHMDFAPHNIFLNMHCFSVLDFNSCKIGFRELDLFSFLSRLDDFAANISASAVAASTLKQEFLMGYGYSNSRPSMPWNLARLQWEVAKMTSIATSHPRWPHIWWANRKRYQYYLLNLTRFAEG